MGKGTRVNNAHEKMFRAIERGDAYETFRDRNPGKLEENPLVRQKDEKKQAHMEKIERLKALRLAKEQAEQKSK